VHQEHEDEQQGHGYPHELASWVNQIEAAEPATPLFFPRHPSHQPGERGGGKKERKGGVPTINPWVVEK